MQHNEVFKTLLAQTASSAVQLAGAAVVKSFNDLMSAAGVVTTENGAADRPTELYAHEVMAMVKPGDETSWQDELELMWTRHRLDTQRLLLSVIAEGIREPITIGNDGRLWDGHHRVAVAAALGIKLPVQYAGQGARR